MVKNILEIQNKAETKTWTLTWNSKLKKATLASPLTKKKIWGSFEQGLDFIQKNLSIDEDFYWLSGNDRAIKGTIEAEGPDIWLDVKLYGSGDYFSFKTAKQALVFFIKEYILEEEEEDK